MRPRQPLNRRYYPRRKLNYSVVPKIPTTPKIAQSKVPLTPPTDLKSAIKFYCDNGWSLVPIHRKIHYLPLPKTPSETLSTNRLQREMKSPHHGIAAVLGKPNNWLTDVDLDFREAVEVAPYLLPKTPAISGRTGKPNSHYWYRCKMQRAQWFFVTKGNSFRPDGHIVECRSTGHQATLPPSPYITGGNYSWNSWGEPPWVDPAVLREAVGRVAVAAYLRTIGWDLKAAVEFVKKPDLRRLKTLQCAGGVPLLEWLGTKDPKLPPSWKHMPRCITCVRSPERPIRPRWNGKLIVIGCGRSGTCFIAQTLRECGLDVWHEKEGKNGTVDWRLTPYNLSNYKYKLHQVRNPLHAIGAIQALPNKAFDYINQFVDIKKGSRLAWCARYWLYWNQFAESKCDFTYRVEDINVALPKILRLINHQHNPTTALHVSRKRNSREQFYKPISWEDLRKADSALCKQVRDLGRKYGY